MSVKIIQKPSMKSYVVDGAELKCTFGIKTSKLMIPVGHGVYIHGKKQANIMDFIPMANIGTFVTCKLTKLPCTPIVVMPWINGKMDATIDHMPCLLKNSIAICSCGGIISITDDGQ